MPHRPYELNDSSYLSFSPPIRTKSHVPINASLLARFEVAGGHVYLDQELGGVEERKRKVLSLHSGDFRRTEMT
jgi:uncharacterized protein (UPF0128 family)